MKCLTTARERLSLPMIISAKRLVTTATTVKDILYASDVGMYSEGQSIVKLL